MIWQYVCVLSFFLPIFVCSSHAVSQLRSHDLADSTSPLSVHPESSHHVQEDSSGIEYTIQIGAFTNQVNAKKLLRKVQKGGYDATIFENMLSGKQLYYLVWVGVYNSAERARADLEVIQARFHVKGVLRTRSAWKR